ncbi:hypothetical protein L7F22_049394 [Adiantum nelumboides]|nr:hypothetical protein [Adiantum nelumboides]
MAPPATAGADHRRGHRRPRRARDPPPAPRRQPGSGTARCCLDGIAYAALPPDAVGGIARGRSWVSVELGDADPGLYADTVVQLGTGVTGNPADVPTLLATLGDRDAVVVGPNAVEGVPATRYKVTIDLARAETAVPDLGPVLRRYRADTGSAGLPTASVPAEVWVDGGGRLRRVVQLLGGAGAVSTVTFGAHGPRPEVPVPGSERVTDLLASLAAAARTPVRDAARAASHHRVKVRWPGFRSSGAPRSAVCDLHRTSPRGPADRPVAARRPHRDGACRRRRPRVGRARGHVRGAAQRDQRRDRRARRRGGGLLGPVSCPSAPAPSTRPTSPGCDARSRPASTRGSAWCSAPAATTPRRGCGRCRARLRRPAREARPQRRGRLRLLPGGPHGPDRLPAPARRRAARRPDRGGPRRHQQRGRARLPGPERGAGRLPAQLVGLRRRAAAGHAARERHEPQPDARMGAGRPHVERARGGRRRRPDLVPLVLPLAGADREVPGRHPARGGLPGRDPRPGGGPGRPGQGPHRRGRRPPRRHRDRDSSLGRGLDYVDQFPRIAATIAAPVVVDLTSVDDATAVTARRLSPPQDACRLDDATLSTVDSVATERWSNLRFARAQAARAGLPAVGENPGPPAPQTGGTASSDPETEQVRRSPGYARGCALAAFYLAFEEDLHTGRSGSRPRTTGRRSPRAPEAGDRAEVAIWQRAPQNGHGSEGCGCGVRASGAGRGHGLRGADHRGLPGVAGPPGGVRRHRHGEGRAPAPRCRRHRRAGARRAHGRAGDRGPAVVRHQRRRGRDRLRPPDRGRGDRGGPLPLRPDADGGGRRRRPARRRGRRRGGPGPARRGCGRGQQVDGPGRDRRAHRGAARPPRRGRRQQPGVPARGLGGPRLPQPRPHRRRLRHPGPRRARGGAVLAPRRARGAHRRRVGRAGEAFLSPGPGWGGSCLPKDTHALLQVADAADFEFRLLRATIDTNTRQRQRIVDKVRPAVTGRRTGSLTRVRLGLLGLTFKAGTDDLRDSPALAVAALLRQAGAELVGYDPALAGRAGTGDLPADLDGIRVVADPLEAAQGAEALVVLTEWPTFRGLDWSGMAGVMKSPTVVDTRNLLDPATLRRAGFAAVGLGRHDGVSAGS